MRPPKQKRGRVIARDSLEQLTTKTRATAEAWDTERHFYKPLAAAFRHDGFEYQQIARERDAAIYEQRWGGCADPSVCYEVIRIRRRDGFQIGARLVEAAEVYPTAEA